MKYLIVFAAAIFSLQTNAQRLIPGMQAPEIMVNQWVKGRPVEKFHIDSVYVLEFWSTASEESKKYIPLLTNLAHKYPEVNILGISVAETDRRKVFPYVNEMGDKMDYSIGIDQHEYAAENEGYMLRYWMRAAGFYTVPQKPGRLDRWPYGVGFCTYCY